MVLTEDSWGCETILYDTITAATCHHTCVQTHRMYTTDI